MLSYIIAIAFFIILEAFFSGSELALFAVNRTRLKYLASEGDKKAQKILKSLEKFDDYVATALIGTTLSIVSATAIFVQFLHELSIYVPFIHSKEEILAEGIIVFTLLFGEIIPKSVFQHYADKLIYFIVPALEFFRKLFFPFLLFAKIVSKIVYFIFRLKPEEGKSWTREELLDALILETEGIPEIEKRIIANVLIFEKRRLGEIVVPLSDVVAISDKRTVIEAVRIFKDTGFSRIPVYRKRIDQIVGVLRAYDMMFAKSEDLVENYMKPIRYLPEFTSLPNVLKGFRQYKDHMVVVVDERGATMGIITLEDVLEEIFGDIRDEFRKKEKRMIKIHTQKELIVDGRIEIKEIETIVNEKFPEGPYETVAGLIIYFLGRMPKKGESIIINNVKFTVLKTNPRRVQEVKIEKLDQQENR
ncbi:MAG: HlyC/CorC family transporter [Aquificae bacterium]|nr:HlyC/CorC family transporter [Aquificota bacterium]